MSRTSVAVTAALVAVVLVGLVPSATTAAPAPSLGVLRAKLADAIADEKRALQLIRKDPPRVRTAEIVLERSIDTLREILSAASLPPAVAPYLQRAIKWDRRAIFRTDTIGEEFIEKGLRLKAHAMKLLTPKEPAPTTPPTLDVQANVYGADGLHAAVCAVLRFPKQPGVTTAFGYAEGGGARLQKSESFPAGSTSGVIVFTLGAGSTYNVRVDILDKTLRGSVSTPPGTKANDARCPGR